MNRRDTLKALGLTAIGSTVLLKSCTTDDKTGKTAKGEVEAVPGREKFETEIVNDLNEKQYFDEHEMATIAILVDIIIPKDDVSGSATDAGVPDFIEFIVKDKPELQTPVRGGLRWLDVQCMKRFEKSFVDCSEQQRIEIVDEIAFPEQAKPEMRQGVSFFNTMRDLTATG